MRIVEGIILISFLSISCISLTQISVKTIRMANKLCELKRRTECLNFVSGSFRSTCHGTGFSSLDEWEKTCREMFSLSSIHWESEKSESKNGSVVVAKWEGPWGKGEASEYVK